MWDTRPVEVVLHLPEGLAEDVEEVQEDDPDFLKKVIRYGLTRRAMFEELKREMGEPGASGGL
mgnify:CR=1 FL=1